MSQLNNRARCKNAIRFNLALTYCHIPCPEYASNAVCPATQFIPTLVGVYQGLGNG